MDRGARWATVHGGHKRVRHDLETKQQQIVHRVVKYLKDNEKHKPL